MRVLHFTTRAAVPHGAQAARAGRPASRRRSDAGRVVIMGALPVWCADTPGVAHAAPLQRVEGVEDTGTSPLARGDGDAVAWPGSHSTSIGIGALHCLAA